MSKISIVIACVNGLPSIDECLSALDNQQGNVNAEVIVVNCCKDETSEHIRKKFPHVKLLEFSERLGIPELRAIGTSHATGDIIAIIEDHCIVQEDWLKEILKAHESRYMVIGGAIENGSVHRIVDWAVFLCEYSKVMPPIPYGETNCIAGNNASYKREALDKVDESIKRNYWEFFLHEELKKLGIKFLSVPAIKVNHKKEFGFLYFLGQRFHYSRSFAGMRRRRVSILKRIYYLLSSPLLPFLMIWRIAKQVLQKKRHRKEFLLSLPILALSLVSYAFGEFVGFLFGPGKSLIKVE